MRDYRNEESYTYTEKFAQSELCQDLWAWEFLRRNPEYRRDWEAALEEKVSSDHAVSHPDFVIRDRKRSQKWGRDNLINPETDQPLHIRFRRPVELHPRLECDFPKKNSLSHFPPKWVVTFDCCHRLHPQMAAARTRLTDEQKWLELCRKDLFEKKTSLEPPQIPRITAFSEERIRVEFDLTKPLPPQCAMALKRLEHFQKSLLATGKCSPLPRCREEFYVELLRIHDAKTAGATPKEIGLHLFPNIPEEFPGNLRSARVRDRLKAAKNMVDRGYLKIIRRHR